MGDFLQTLLNASEKAANIARSCVGLSDISDSLLVAEKCESEANSRFDKDFKTIADVLAQETARSIIIKDYPELKDNVRGEECAEICGHEIKLLNTEAETEKLLKSVVTANLASQMAKAAHSDVQNDYSSLICDGLPEVDTTNLGVWIDPIDATAEFIAGVQGNAKPGAGLECVTVLIGAYLRTTGEPVLGVINQPFYKNGKGRVMWGLSFDGFHKWGGNHIEETSTTKVILMSNAEESKIKQKLLNSSFNIDTAPGAGNKLMKVALGEAIGYVLSKGTTFLWDTCAPHAILKAKGGDIKTFKFNKCIKYNIPECDDNQQYCNSDGIIAYANDVIFNDFKKAFV
ncbi:unnamed protein product [Chilo suppressalis]|uniref:Inositol polyphosphate 1-phosphatase n=1 Tax=Chilo suppressalis TaxID=168631 RepID=A0ABN8BBL4_CHISP|nr:hypothetical protein evm_011947 [Chilo suppressalis]CAH0407291.1 unnamed protein product [Chilo suppressalis]